MSKQDHPNTLISQDQSEALDKVKVPSIHQGRLIVRNLVFDIREKHLK
jgi:hypothetical protein